MRPKGLEESTPKPARIEEVEIKKISEIWRKKPRGLRFNDTDALIITLKTEDGKTIRDTFYLCLKPDGTFDVDTLRRDSSMARRQRLAIFLKHYNLADNIENHNLREGIETWKGEWVSILEVDGSGFIVVS